ncbi:DUF308 domain-containing protein [Companilactobacillus halodurans]|uniref:DUF308 domain-containing protein n=1 Tax=Companilactobacillus halodurans TaxID=2584183 RepID=A0A5P0ZRE9_9LACO|nr:DUF308 domain-containing protein [Companilactobacillus halodurans]MQS76772.1 hypothetical protein [Companilactobacillus halodurans]MQS98024.1 hypothetical protein [Companilactobacillus halodurans]
MVKQFQLYRWLRFIFLLVAGILIVVAPIKSFDIIIYIVSSYIAIYGILSIIDGFSIRKLTGENNIAIALGIGALFLALGVLLFAKFLIALVPPVLGIILLVNGINQFRDSHEMTKRVKIKPYLDYFYSALLVAAGIVFILNPSKTIIFIYQLFGVGLILLAFFEIINSRIYRD